MRRHIKSVELPQVIPRVMEVVDLALICRLCAKENECCVDVFGEDGKKNSIAKKIRLCLPITVKYCRFALR
jgi:hypothetical protein